MSDTETGLREEAERRAQARMSVRVHAFVYVLVNAGLLALDYLTDGRFDWAWWPMLGWGIGLLAHFISVSYAVRRPRPGGGARAGVTAPATAQGLTRFAIGRTLAPWRP
jgi:hypothetical protein